ncbi:MAG TPA: hypothetical protein VEP73_11780 [Actinomycetota bacterium]|nr:hypothetical protein [Actinomycetota bacterium]
MVTCALAECFVYASFYWKPDDGRRLRRYSCTHHLDQVDPGPGWTRHGLVLPFTA